MRSSSVVFSNENCATRIDARIDDGRDRRSVVAVLATVLPLRSASLIVFSSEIALVALTARARNRKSNRRRMQWLYLRAACGGLSAVPVPLERIRCQGASVVEGVLDAMSQADEDLAAEAVGRT